MASEPVRAQLRSYRTFLDVLYGILIGFLITRLQDFQFFALTEAGGRVLLQIAPFVVLYLLYLLKLTLFWLGSRNSLKIMTEYAPYEVRGHHYLATIVSALLITQVVSSLVFSCELSGGSAIETHMLYFLTWMTIGTVVGDAVPTLVVVLPVVRKQLTAAQHHAELKKSRESAKELAVLMGHYDGPIKRNGYLNIGIAVLAWSLYFPLVTVDTDPILCAYALAGLLLATNLVQEALLWHARESQLRRFLQAIRDDS